MKMHCHDRNDKSSLRNPSLQYLANSVLFLFFSPFFVTDVAHSKYMIQKLSQSPIQFFVMIRVSLQTLIMTVTGVFVLPEGISFTIESENRRWTSYDAILHSSISTALALRSRLLMAQFYIF